MNKLQYLRLGVLSSAIMLSFSASASIEVDRSQLRLAPTSQTPVSSKGIYIVQLKGESGIRKAVAGKSLPTRTSTQALSIDYDANSASTQSYILQLLNKQRSIIAATGIPKPLHTYGHTFNGFSVKLSDKQVQILKTNPDVLNVWPEEVMKLDTANTPEYLGLTKSGGLHLNGMKGEDVIIGVIDTGINPVHPSFSDDGSYSSPEELGWSGTCDNSTDQTFTCSNKLIGARFFNASFNAASTMAASDIASPRDTDGHGSHTASTAGGNVVPASYHDTDAGIASGMAPRARIASYKACWDAVNPDEKGCYPGDTMAAIEAAVEDGVDVINYSIGGSLTQLLTATSTAFLNASIAGVYTATSAGNDGPDVSTTGMPVPWVTNVGAATYDGVSITDALQVTSAETTESVISLEGTITQPLSVSGNVTGKIVVAEPLDGCFVDEQSAALTNATDILDNIALIKRGACNFSEKIERAQLAGARAVVVYSDGRPITVMGGTGSYNIPGVMVDNLTGEAINADTTNGEEIEVAMGPGITLTQMQTGGMMGDFSSRGPSLAVADLAVPDIAAPGVTILAAAPNGDDFGYLTGTSMASPHIAGIGALIKEVHPTWTPAMIQSAMMTTARQDITKEDGITPADPFDFGAGHVVPNDAINPGLVYNAIWADYAGFICGKADEANFVPSEFGNSCDAFANAGFLGGADYNQPSVTVSELGAARTITRQVTNVTSEEVTFTATLVSPEGIDAEVFVYVEGAFVATESMTIAAGKTATYALSMSPTETSELDTWKFGSISWSDGIHNSRIPLSVKAILPPQIEVVSEIVTDAEIERPRMIFPVTTNYNGVMKVKGHGMAAGEFNVGQVSQDADRDFTFNEASLGVNIMLVEPETKIVRFALYGDQLPNPAMDLDLYIYQCTLWNCALVGSSLNAGSDESVTLFNPEVRNNDAPGNVYLAFVHGYDLAGEENVLYPLNEFHVGSLQRNLNVRARSTAREGSQTRVSLNMRDLIKGQHYLGGVSFTNGEDDDIGFTLIEVNR